MTMRNDAGDWSVLMQRKDYTLDEKRKNWDAHCTRRGIKSDPRSYQNDDGAA